MRRLALILLVLLTLSTTATWAQQSTRFEITPFFGHRFGGSFDDVSTGGAASLSIRDSSAYGLSFGVLFPPEAELEIIWSRQNTQLRSESFLGPTQNGLDLTVDTYHVGGLYLFNEDVKRVQGFFSFSAGLTRFVPPGGFNSENRFSVSAGIGVKFFPTRHVGLRLHLRVIPTYFSSNGTSVFCSSAGVCHIVVSGDFIVQAELAGGVIFAF